MIHRAKRGQQRRPYLGILLAVGLLLGGAAPSARAGDLAGRQTVHASAAYSPMADQTVTLQPTQVESVGRVKAEGGTFETDSYGIQVYGCTTTPQLYCSHRSAKAGWQQVDPENATTDKSITAETALRFDLGPYYGAQDKLERAVIRFDETADRWTSGSGAPQLKEGCVARLGIATTDWYNQPVNALFPHRNYSAAPDGSSRAWEVTRHLKEQLAAPGNTSLQHGFVFQGAMDLTNLNADDDTSCMSLVGNFRLDLTLDEKDVPQENPAPPAAPAAPAPPPAPTHPDLAINRLSGPTTMFDGATATFEIVFWNDGTPAGNAQLQINMMGEIEPVEVEVVNNPAITCEANSIGTPDTPAFVSGFMCTGALGGFNDAIQTQGAVIRVVARGTGKGSAVVVASANHDRRIDPEMTIDNNLKLIEVAVQ